MHRSSPRRASGSRSGRSTPSRLRYTRSAPRRCRRALNHRSLRPQSSFHPLRCWRPRHSRRSRPCRPSRGFRPFHPGARSGARTCSSRRCIATQGGIRGWRRRRGPRSPCRATRRTPRTQMRRAPQRRNEPPVKGPRLSHSEPTANGAHASTRSASDRKSRRVFGRILASEEKEHTARDPEDNPSAEEHTGHRLL